MQYAQDVKATLGGIQDTVRHNVDRSHYRYDGFPSRIYEPPVRVSVQFSTSNIIDDPVTGFGNDILVGNAPMPN